ncbi:MAG: ABC transporter ATP-binding protein, partial [Vallitaleaceae bacterium]|nr:ABC transporter ATP-binding protein [Vallitaleaceae bacterium]
MASNKRNTFNEDELLEQEFNAAQMKKLLRYVARHKKDLFVAIVIILLSSAVGLIGPLLMMHVIDDFIPKKNINMLIVSALAFTGLTIFSAVCMNLRIKFMSQIGQSVVRDIRSDIFSHIQKLPFTFYDSRPHGKILVRVVNYVNSLSDLLSNGLINLIVDFFSFFVAFAIMLALEVRLTLMVFAFVPVAGYLIFLVKGKQRRSMQELSAKQSNMNAYIHESISGMKVTQSFTREDVNEKVFIDLMDENKDVWMKSRHYLALIFPIVKNISVLSQCLML